MLENRFAKYLIVIVLLTVSSLSSNTVLPFLKCCVVCHSESHAELFLVSRFPITHVLSSTSILFLSFIRIVSHTSISLLKHIRHVTQTDVWCFVKKYCSLKNILRENSTPASKNHKSIQSTLLTSYLWG